MTEEMSIFYVTKNPSGTNHSSRWLEDNSILKTKLNVTFPLTILWERPW